MRERSTGTGNPCGCPYVIGAWALPESGLAVFAWLNILSEDGVLTFRNDSLFVNDGFQNGYRIEDRSLFYKDDDGFKKACDYTINDDELTLTNTDEGVVVRLKKVKH
jgi:hypothetical protein